MTGMQHSTTVNKVSYIHDKGKCIIDIMIYTLHICMNCTNVFIYNQYQLKYHTLKHKGFCNTGKIQEGYPFTHHSNIKQSYHNAKAHAFSLSFCLSCSVRNRCGKIIRPVKWFLGPMIEIYYKCWKSYQPRPFIIGLRPTGILNTVVM